MKARASIVVFQACDDYYITARPSRFLDVAVSYCLPLTCQVERTDVSLSDPRDPVVRGTRFPGHSYYQFPSSTIPANTDFTGKWPRAAVPRSNEVTCLCLSPPFFSFFFRFCAAHCSISVSKRTSLHNDFHSHPKGQLSFCLPASLEG